jgi:ABC-type Fe3+ transport system substrate-binding protein
VSRDPNGAWVGGAGRAIVLLVSDRRGSRRPTSIEDLSNPRFRGRVATPPLDGPLMRALRAALTEVWGAARTNSLFADIQRNELAVAPDEETAARFAAAGRVVFAVVGSDVAQRYAERNPSVQVVEPDQDYDGLFFVPSLFTIPADAKDPKAAEALAARLSVLPLPGRVAPRADLRLLAATTLTSWPPTPHVVVSRAPGSLPEAVPPISTPPTEGP